MKKTLKALEEQIAKLKAEGKGFINEARNREVARPYHYYATTKELEADGKTVKGEKANVARVAELHAHVQTAKKLGFETILEAEDDGRLQVVFVKKLPATPFEFLY